MKGGKETGKARKRGKEETTEKEEPIGKEETFITTLTGLCVYSATVALAYNRLFLLFFFLFLLFFFLFLFRPSSEDATSKDGHSAGRRHEWTREGQPREILGT